MTSSPAPPAIAVATSIPPRLARQDEGRLIGEEYQRLCIRSWVDCGFRILSVNDREEIPDLAARYPEVHFIAADRNASAWSGRKNPYIADLLLALKDAPEPVLGIVNSDLVFEPSAAWRAHLPALVGEAIVVGHRCDATSLLRGAFRRYPWGLDFFFFDKTVADKALEHAMPFAMGLPWWDYWLPCTAALNGRRILVAGHPNAVHLFHKRNYPQNSMREFADIFANFVIGGFERAAHAAPEVISAIVPICRQIAALPRASGTDNRRMSELGRLFAPHLGKNVIRLEANLPPESGTPSNDGADLPDPTGLADALTVENVFRRFDRRLAAGEALRRANKLLSEERWAEAEPELRAARKETPDDFDVLFVFGGLALHRGEFQNAYDMLSKAAGLQPDSTEVLQRLGAVLHAMGEREEAIECFQKILHLDPKNQDAHTDLAIVLWETNRRGEALAQLEQAKERWPNFNRAAELYDHFRKQERLSP